jgi:ubiquinone/menaquinone biosynthesis C-methylase UbiE
MDNNENPEILGQKQGVAGIFDCAAPTYDHVGPRFLSHFGRRLVELAQIPAGAGILDIAAGRGAVLFPAAEMVGPQGHLVGIDISREMVEQSREEIKQRGLQNVEVHEMDAEYLQFSDALFDRVLCSFALFFFPQLDRAMAEMVRVLKPGGRIGVTTWAPVDERWKWSHDLIDSYLSSGEPETESTEEPESKPIFHTPEGLQAILASVGFVDIEIISESKEFFYTDEEEWWSTLWSHGYREPLEMIEKKKGPEGLKQFQSEAFKTIQGLKRTDGIPQIFTVLFGFASKP